MSKSRIAPPLAPATCPGEAERSRKPVSEAVPLAPAKLNEAGPADRLYQPNPQVVELPAACPRCGGLRKPGEIIHSRTFPQSPLTIAGKLYRGRVVRRIRCSGCGLRYQSSVPLDLPEPRPA